VEKSKKLDLVFLLIYPILGAIVSHLLKINAFGSVVVFFVIPSVYLTLKAPQYFKKAFLFSLLAIPFIVVVDYVAHLTGQWIIPHSMFPRVFQYITVEIIFWAVLNFYFVTIFYEYFLHHHFTKKPYSSKIKYPVAGISLLFIIFLFFYNFFPGYLHIPFFYLTFGTIFILIPIILQFFYYPKFIFKFFIVAAYFFFVTFIYETAALQLGWWGFPGQQFIGWVSVFNVKFPIEEFVFWLLLLAMAILSYYEFFDNDEK
jgi:hypothetical protein